MVRVTGTKLCKVRPEEMLEDKHMSIYFLHEILEIE